ncbi:MAG TPA: transcriptional regulator [Acidimicrobiia bacterium]|nr:transcriptional regulator [Acidimicrobiia bacterium]
MAGSHPLGSEDAAAKISAIAALNEPIRRNLYAYIVEQPDAVGRDKAAEALGITRELAAFHLDKLLEEGLLDVEYRRISGRSGPGAGRPAKLYRPSGRHVQVSLPERRYDLAARLMAEALEDPKGDPAAAVDRAARRFGETIGTEARRHLGRRPSATRLLERACAVLREYGFEPVRLNDEIRLRNCPFDAVAKDHTALVCGMNRALAEGMVKGLGAEGIDVYLDPMPGTCCVALAATTGRKPKST